MIKFYQKILRRPVYNFFWKKKSQNQDQQNIQNNSQGEWNKEEYLADLKKKREEYEKIKIKAQKEAHTQTIRQAREHEVNYGRVDFAKVFIDNINIKYSDQFSSAEEMFNFLGTLKVQLTEENLMTCVNALIQFADKISEEDLIRYEFLEFQTILTKQLRIINKTENLVKITKLLDILCLPSEHEIWSQLEYSLMKRIGKLSFAQLLEVLNHLSNQKEGSDQFWDQNENYITHEISKLENIPDAFQSIITVLMCYWRVQRGTKQFVTQLVKTLLNIYSESIQNEEIPTNIIIQSVLVLGQLTQKEDASELVQSKELKIFFEDVENYLQKQIDTLEFQQLCLISQGFGFEFGSEQFMKQLENKILSNIDKYELKEIKLIIKSFMMTYRGSKQLFNLMINKILTLKHEFTSIELSHIVKAYYITENDNTEFYLEIERKVLQRLKEVREITPEEIFEIAFSYLITRVGTREFYKLLEIVITFRFEDLQKNAILLSKLHDLYVKSGLCDTKLIERMAAVL